MSGTTSMENTSANQATGQDQEAESIAGVSVGDRDRDQPEAPENIERPKPEFCGDGGLKLLILILTLIDTFVSVLLGAFLLLYYTVVVYKRTMDINTRICYNGAGWAFYLVILSPSYVMKRRCVTPRWSFIWVLRYRYALWIALGLSIFYTIVILVFLSYDAEEQITILGGIMPLIALRIALWICYIVHGIRPDFYEPRNRFWPYLYDADEIAA